MMKGPATPLAPPSLLTRGAKKIATACPTTALRPSARAAAVAEVALAEVKVLIVAVAAAVTVAVAMVPQAGILRF